MTAKVEKLTNKHTQKPKLNLVDSTHKHRSEKNEEKRQQVEFKIYKESNSRTNQQYHIGVTPKNSDLL
jgi:hypothetical protein